MNWNANSQPGPRPGRPETNSGVPPILFQSPWRSLAVPRARVPPTLLVRTRTQGDEALVRPRSRTTAEAAPLGDPLVQARAGGLVDRLQLAGLAGLDDERVALTERLPARDVRVEAEEQIRHARRVATDRQLAVEDERPQVLGDRPGRQPDPVRLTAELGGRRAPLGGPVGREAGERHARQRALAARACRERGPVGAGGTERRGVRIARVSAGARCLSLPVLVEPAQQLLGMQALVDLQLLQRRGQGARGLASTQVRQRRASRLPDVHVRVLQRMGCDGYVRWSAAPAEARHGRGAHPRVGVPGRPAQRRDGLWIADPSQEARCSMSASIDAIGEPADQQRVRASRPTQLARQARLDR